MGGTTFDVLVPGADVAKAFRQGSEDAAFEHGHGGYTGTLAEKPSYTVITRTPMVLEAANQLSQELIDKQDPRIDDKWGPAGAIPVILPTRTVTVGPFDYTHTYTADEQKELVEAVTPLVKLRKGESVRSARLQIFSTPNPAHYSFQRRVSEQRSQCQAEVTINKPPVTRKATIEVTIPEVMTTNEWTGQTYPDWEKRQALLKAEAEKMRLKLGERVISVRELAVKPAATKVTAEAPKGGTETRYIIKGVHGADTWETGLPSQAAARTKAVEAANRAQGSVTFEVEAITRRTDGQPLVRVTRTVSTIKVELEVTIGLNVTLPTTPDAWLFFGWAST